MPVAAEIFYSSHKTEDADQIPVVLIHGAGGTHLYWPPEIRRLPGYQVFSLDLPGHGKSPGLGQQSINAYADQVMAWQDEMDLAKIILAGHSMGAAIALMLALDHPSIVHSLILLGAGARLRVHPDLLAGSANEANFPAVVKMVIEWSFSPQAPPRLVELATQRMIESSARILHGDFVACNDFDITTRLDNIACPTLVICGDEDRLTPLRYAQFLADHIRDASQEIIPGSGHMVMLEKSRDVQNVMLKFLRRLASNKMSSVKT